MVTSTLFTGTDAETCEDPDQIPHRIGRSSLLWLDLSRDRADLARAAGLLEIEERTLNRLTEPGDEPALDDLVGYTHVTACVPVRDTSPAELVRVDCLVGERWVVTVHDTPLEVLDDFAERMSGSGATGRLDGPTFLATLLDWVLGEYARSFEAVEAELEETDVRSLQGKLADPEDEIRGLVSLRREIGSLHRSLTAHREPLVALTHPELDALSTEESARRFTKLVERFDVTVEAGRDARSAVVASFDVLMARTEHRTNEILKILTLASVLFLPGSLIAAVLGMNFDVPLFDHPGLFWVVVATVAGIVVGSAAAARYRNWV